MFIADLCANSTYLTIQMNAPGRPVARTAMLCRAWKILQNYSSYRSATIVVPSLFPMSQTCPSAASRS